MAKYSTLYVALAIAIGTLIVLFAAIAAYKAYKAYIAPSNPQPKETKQPDAYMYGFWTDLGDGFKHAGNSLVGAGESLGDTFAPKRRLSAKDWNRAFRNTASNVGSMGLLTNPSRRGIEEHQSNADTNAFLTQQ